jgi:hypothetical protein
MENQCRWFWSRRCRSSTSIHPHKKCARPIDANVNIGKENQNNQNNNNEIKD